MTCWAECFGGKRSSLSVRTEDINKEISSVKNAKLYSYKELQAATENFSPANKIGQGGFGSVYKGILNDGTVAAMKVLSAESEQGVDEFMTEIMVITGVEHENLVKLLGCCTERNQRILVYRYLENNSLAQTLLGSRFDDSQFSWKVRRNICIGVAQGLEFLHDVVKPHIVHRDIKASNILLDRDFTPKISDFGLAKLFPATITHVSTRVAGTLGYLAPEYAIQGKLTRKADIYSFGVLLMEIVSGRCNINKRLPAADRNLLERAWRLHEKDRLVELLDCALDEDQLDPVEACKYMKVGLLCTQDMPKKRPTMSVVVRMLKGKIDVDEMMISKPALLSELITLKGSSSTQRASSSVIDASSSSQSTDMSHVTMTFTSIYDR